MPAASHRLLEKATQYASEMLFLRQVAADFGSGLALFLQTVQFHLGNTRRLPAWGGRAFAANVNWNGQILPLRLRAHMGDLFVFYEVLMDGCYFIPEALCPRNQVRTIIDCGANVGLTSLYLADRYPAARILAVEPHPANFALLRHNTASQRRITPIQACVVSGSDRSCFIETDRPAWGNRSNDEGKGVPVPGLSLETLCRTHQLDSIDILKVDIEGAERHLFSSAGSGFLSRTGFIVIELHDNYDIACFRRDIEPYGFTVLPPSPQLGTRMITARRVSQTLSPSVGPTPVPAAPGALT